MNTDSTKYAGLWPRFIALFIDLILFCVVFFPVQRLIKGVWLMDASDHIWNYGAFIWDPICLAYLIIMAAYYVLLEGLRGQTLGKWLTGIRVITRDGQKPGIWKAFLRNLLRLVDGLPAMSLLGIILILSTFEKTRTGDLVAGTRVVKICRK